jgi:hypothetical protein
MFRQFKEKNKNLLRLKLKSAVKIEQISVVLYMRFILNRKSEFIIYIFQTKFKKVKHATSRNKWSVCWSSSSITYLSPLEGYCFSRSSACQCEVYVQKWCGRSCIGGLFNFQLWRIYQWMKFCKYRIIDR